MTEAPKKIWAADQEFAEGIEGPWHVDKSVYGGDLYHHDAEVQRLVAEARAERVTVKPLVWEEDPRGGWRRGRVVGLSPPHKQEATIFRSEVGWQYMGDMYLSAHDSLDDALSRAKAAAQADYDRRILSALSDAPLRHGDMTSLGQPVSFTYTNWRGETARRTAIPKRVWFGTTEWHKGPGWLMTAWDLEKAADRDFALADCTFAPPRQVTPQEAAKVLADWIDSDMVSANQLIDSIEGVTMETPLRHWLSQCVLAVTNGGDSDG